MLMSLSCCFVDDCSGSCNGRGTCSYGYCFCNDTYYGDDCQFRNTSTLDGITYMFFSLCHVMSCHCHMTCCSERCASDVCWYDVATQLQQCTQCGNRVGQSCHAMSTVKMSCRVMFCVGD